jgi:hypothetical protein
VAVPDIATLEVVLERIKRYGRTRTSIILSSPVESKAVLPAEAGEPAPRPPALPARAARNGRAARGRRAQAGTGGSSRNPHGHRGG